MYTAMAQSLIEIRRRTHRYLANDLAALIKRGKYWVDERNS